MKLITAAAICVLTLYVVDAYFFDGVYFRAVEDMTSQIGF